MFYMVIVLLCSVKTVHLLNKTIGQHGDTWYWGYVNETESENRHQDKEEIQSRTEIGYGPCAVYDPSLPSFKKPGRKISEEKCEEYIWQVKKSEEQSRRAEECNSRPNHPQPPITIGGRPTYAGEFPHMGALGWQAVPSGYIFKCGSTLISHKFVLTAAHCSSAPLYTNLADTVAKIVRLNDKNLFNLNDAGFYTSTDVNISRIIVHPEYKPPKKYFDIALMELEREVYFTLYMQPACLWNKHDVSELGRDATLTGWGVLAHGSHEISPELRAGDVNLIDSEKCDNLLFSSRNRNWRGLQEHQLCAGNLAGGVDACQGDSGGPLQVVRTKTRNSKFYNVIGVTSFGIGCALPNLPGIYTRVSSFIDWIEQYVWE